MERIEAYRVASGEVFTDHGKAKSYVDEQYGAIITLHAARLVHIHKYVDFVEYLESNLENLVEAFELRKDRDTVTIS